MKKLIHWTVALGLCLTLVVCGALADEAPVISVQLDGHYLSFTDAVPQVKDQRTFLPFRAVFEAMGVQVDYQDGVITAVRGDKTLTMTLDQSVATVTENGKATDITMDVAPYADLAIQRTYVPVRFAAQAFDCMVGWDQRTSTAIIIDLEKLENAATQDKRYTYLDKVTAMSEKYERGIWDFTATFDGDMTGATMRGTVSSTTQDGYKMSADINMKIDMSETMAILTAQGVEISPEDQASYDAWKTDGIDICVRGDMAQDKLYMNMSAKALGTQSAIDPNVWYSLDMATMPEIAGMNFIPVMSKLQGQNISSLIRTPLAVVQLDDSVHAYAEVESTVDTVAKSFCDDGFVLVDGQWVASYEKEQDDADVTLALVLELDGENMKGYSLGVNTAIQVGDLASNTSMAITLDDQDTINAEITTDLGELFQEHITLNGKYTPGDTAPVITPPQGATVLDYMETLNAQADPDAGVIR